MTSPTIQIVTVGTDWPAIVSAVVTGTAAIAGIGGTAWQAARGRQASLEDRQSASDDLKRSLDQTATNLRISNAAEEQRAIQAEKIRIYSAFQGAVDAVIAVAGQSEQQAGEFSQARLAMLKATAEVALVAPKKIGDLADKVARSVNSSIGPSGVRSNVDPRNTIQRDREELYRIMRTDLGTDGTQPTPTDSPLSGGSRGVPRSLRRAGHSRRRTGSADPATRPGAADAPGCRRSGRHPVVAMRRSALAITVPSEPRLDILLKDCHPRRV
jgi:hypothetical protein